MSRATVWMALVAWIGMGKPASADTPRATCDWPRPSFGWKLPREGVPAAYIEQIPIDGLIRIPVNHSIGLVGATKVDPVDVISVLVSRAGSPVEGSFRVVDDFPFWATLVADGQHRLIDWTAKAPLATNATYSVKVTFDNERLSSCPIAVPREAMLTVTTGSGYARDALVPGAIGGIVLREQRRNVSGACDTATGDSCIYRGKCTQCWRTTIVTVATVSWTTSLTSPYFAHTLARADVDVNPEKFSRNAPRGVSETQMTGVDVQAQEACYRLASRAMAGGPVAWSETLCAKLADRVVEPTPQGFHRVLSSTCVDGPGRSLSGFLEVAYGTKPLDCLPQIPPPKPPWQVGEDEDVTSPRSASETTAEVDAEQRDQQARGCSVLGSAGTVPRVGPFLLALCALASGLMRRRRLWRRRQNAIPPAAISKTALLPIS